MPRVHTKSSKILHYTKYFSLEGNLDLFIVCFKKIFIPENEVSHRIMECCFSFCSHLASSYEWFVKVLKFVLKEFQNSFKQYLHHQKNVNFTK